MTEREDTRVLLSSWDLDRLALVLTSLSFFNIGTTMWWAADLQKSVFSPLAVIALILLGLVSMLLALATVRIPRIDRTIFVVTVVAIAVGGYVFMTQVAEGYGSDAMLFTRYAAHLFLQGENPYTSSMEGAYDLFRAPPIALTPTMDGQSVSNFNYPALSFLYYAAFLAFGISDARFANIPLVIGVLTVLYWAAPRPYRVLVPPLFLANISQVVTALNDNDFVFILPLMFAVIAWEYAESESASALFLGLAAATKQTVWFIAPFFAYRVIRTRHGSGRSQVREIVRIGTIAVILFVLPNLYFILRDPVAWYAGVFTPFTGGGGTPLVIYGQGLSVFEEAGLVLPPRWVYTVTTMGALAALLVAYHVWFEKLEDVLWVVPPIVLLFNYRGLSKYYEFFALVALLIVFLRIRRPDRSALTSASFVPSLPIRRIRRQYLVLVTVCLIVLAVSSLVIGGIAPPYASPKPIEVEVLDQDDPDDIGRISTLTVELTNTDSEPHTISTAIYGQTANIYYWEGGSNIILQPGETEQLELEAGSFEVALPDDEEYFVRVNEYDSSTILGTSDTYTADSSFPALMNPNFSYYEFSMADGDSRYIGWEIFTDTPGDGNATVTESPDEVTLTATRPTETSTGATSWSISSVQQITDVDTTVCPQFDADRSTFPDEDDAQSAEMGVSVESDDGILRVLYVDGLEKPEVETRIVGETEHRYLYYPASDDPPCVDIGEEYERAGWERPEPKQVEKYGEHETLRPVLIRTFVGIHPDAEHTDYELVVESLQQREEHAELTADDERGEVIASVAVRPSWSILQGSTYWMNFGQNHDEHRYDRDAIF